MEKPHRMAPQKIKKPLNGDQPSPLRIPQQFTGFPSRSGAEPKQIPIV